MTPEPPPPYVTRRTVDANGSLAGLDEHRDHDVLVVRIPRLDREEIDAWVARLEEESARVARDLGLDEAKARGLVRDTARTAESAARGVGDVVNRLATPLMVQKESMEEQQAVKDVAAAAQRGGADWTPNPADAPEAGVRGRHEPGAGGP